MAPQFVTKWISFDRKERVGITNVGYWLKFNGLQYIKYYSYVHMILSSKVNKVPFSSVCLQEVNQNTLPDVADMSHIIMCKKQIGIIQTGCHCAVPCRPDPISPIVFPSCHRVTHPQVLPPSTFISSSMLSLFDRGIVLAVSSHHVSSYLNIWNMNKNNSNYWVPILRPDSPASELVSSRSYLSHCVCRLPPEYQREYPCFSYRDLTHKHFRSTFTV